MGILKMKEENMIKRSTMGSQMRKRLSDITNIHSRQKSPLKDQENSHPAAAADDSYSKNYVQQILKENAMMMRLVKEKDKIIELNGLELQKLRLNLQKVQLQNLQLAQSNTQMLAELNMGKDRLKALHHELACKDALYKAKILDLQEKAKLDLEENSILEGETKPEKAVVDQTKQDNDGDENKVSKSKRGRPARSQSLGPTRAQQAVDKDVAETKRRCLRRQSVRLNPQEAQADLFEIEVGTPLTEKLKQPLHRSNLEKQDVKESHSQSSKQSLPQRSSIGRPLRKAAEKVQSYKDPSCKIKLRRPE